MNKMIKSLVLAAMVLFSVNASAFAQRYYEVDYTSNTETNDAEATIDTINGGDVLKWVLVGECGTSALVSMWDSRTDEAGALQDLGDIDTDANCPAIYHYDVKLSSGLTYTTTGGADVTFGFKDNSR